MHGLEIWPIIIRCSQQAAWEFSSRSLLVRETGSSVQRHPDHVAQIRHGQGYHNVAGEQDEENYKLEEFRDAHLTELGWTQVLPVCLSLLV